MSDVATVKVPKTLGACADRLHKIREEAAALNRQVERLQTEARAIKEHLIQTLPKGDASGVLGKLAKAVITTKTVASVKDWEAFYRHVLKTKDFSLLQRRVADVAVRERWGEGEQVPGVEPFTVVDVSVTKLT